LRRWCSASAGRVKGAWRGEGRRRDAGVAKRGGRETRLAVAKSEETKEGTATVRRLTLHGGGSIVERLEGKDDKKRTYSYSIVAGPLPVAGYKATLHVEENKDGKSCNVEWSSTFEPSGASAPEAVKVIRGIYEAGFDNLRKMFGGDA
jgi:Polyketide cyclase / dehydrase and lipid transport